MKTRLSVPHPGRNLKRMVVSLAVAVLLAVSLLLVSVLLPSPDVSVHVLNAPAAIAAQAPSSSGVSGTLASFAALFPEMTNVYLPTIER